MSLLHFCDCRKKPKSTEAKIRMVEGIYITGDQFSTFHGILNRTAEFACFCWIFMFPRNFVEFGSGRWFYVPFSTFRRASHFVDTPTESCVPVYFHVLVERMIRGWEYFKRVRDRVKQCTRARVMGATFSSDGILSFSPFFIRLSLIFAHTFFVIAGGISLKHVMQSSFMFAHTLLLTKKEHM